MSKFLNVQDTFDFNANNIESVTQDFDVRNASTAIIWVKLIGGTREAAILEICGSLVTEGDDSFEFERTGKKIAPNAVRVLVDCSAYAFINVIVDTAEGGPSTLSICINSFE